MNATKEGWVYIDGAAKWHYVGHDGRSLCGRWLFVGSAVPDQENDASPDNCGTCRKKLAARKLASSLPGYRQHQIERKIEREPDSG